MAFSIDIKDYSSEFLAEVADKIPVVLEECGLVAEGYAKRLCPVDTGNLRNSITHTVVDNTMYLGTNVYYGPYVEMGTSKTRAQPFIRPALEDNETQYRDIIDSGLRG